jgi:hypothetical protein
MRLPLSLVFAALLAVVPIRASAQTSTNDLLGLKAAGFSDDILIALIQTDGSMFTLAPDDLIFLKHQGVSERLMLAMLATRPPTAVAAPTQPEPVVVHVDQTVTQTVEQRVEAPRERTRTVHVPVPVVISAPRVRAERAPEPVYWGFGGKPRPGSWAPSTPVAPVKKPGSGSAGGGGGSF